MKIRPLFILFSLLAIAIVWLFAYSSGTPIEQYIPTNTNEKEIVDVLITFQRAKQQYDIEEYLSCLDENGSYMFSGHLMVSKKELSTLLPDFWKRLQENDPQIQPVSRENLNGNFFNGAFFDPSLSIHGNTAKATVIFETPLVKWRTLLFTDLIKRNGKWLINRYEWDMG